MSYRMQAAVGVLGQMLYSLKRNMLERGLEEEMINGKLVDCCKCVLEDALAICDGQYSDDGEHA